LIILDIIRSEYFTNIKIETQMCLFNLNNFLHNYVDLIVYYYILCIPGSTLPIDFVDYRSTISETKIQVLTRVHQLINLVLMLGKLIWFG